LLPKSGIPLFLSTTTVNTALKTDRNHTISIAGMWGINLTDTFINAKNTLAKSMDCTGLIFKDKALEMRFDAQS
jgi:hypothetical protein